MKRRRGTFAILLACALLLLAALAWPSARRHWRAATLLTRLRGGEAPDVEARELRLGSVRAHRYAGGEDGPLVVLVHGVHPDGIDEPRLVRFAQALAASGLVVYTPELEALAGARLDPSASSVLANACEAIARHERRPSLGVIGISFGGGLALLAASQVDVIGAVLAIGAHHDAAGLARGWLSAAGARERYGIQVLAHAYADEYLEPVPDPSAAQAVLASLLREEPAAVDALSPEARALVDPLRHGHALTPVVPRLRAIVDAHAADLAALSPAGRVTRLDVPVFLLHGEGDPLIASSESERIYRELPPRARGGLLLTPLIGHADQQEVSLLEQLEVVRFMAGFLEAL